MSRSQRNELGPFVLNERHGPDASLNQENQTGRWIDEPHLVILLLRVRTLVGRHFGFDLCSNPAWDMLLDLYSTGDAGRMTSLSSLSHAANVPARTALSWIHRMVDRGLLKRMPDSTDRRRVNVELTDQAMVQFKALLQDISASG